MTEKRNCCEIEVEFVSCGVVEYGNECIFFEAKNRGCRFMAGGFKCTSSKAVVEAVKGGVK